MYEFSTVKEDTARMHMWANLLGRQYLKANKSKKKKMKITWANVMGCKPHQIGADGKKMSGFDLVPMTLSMGCLTPLQPWQQAVVNTIADCPKAADPLEPILDGALELAREYQEQPNKGNNAMNTEREYLSYRLDNLYSGHNAQLRKQFHMDAEYPTSTEEAIERIKADKVTVKSAKESKWYESWTDRIIWRDPATPADEVGYKASEKKLTDAFQEANDVIRVLDETKGLEALNAFKTATFH